MTTRLSRFTVPALSLTVVLALAGCGDNGDEDSSPTTGSNAEAATSDNAPAVDDTDTPAEDNTPEDDAGNAGDSGDPGSDDVTAGALQAIATAEAEAGGVAYAIDDENDDRSWEVDVAVDERNVEVIVSADGNEVRDTENDDDLDDDDRTGVERAEVTITDAIEAAVAEVGGSLDDAELDADDDQFAWEVTVDSSDRDDIEVHVDIVDGSVLNVDRD